MTLPDIESVLSGDSPGCIVCGDCLEVLRDMPDGCVDLVFGSPPYEARRTYGIGFKLKGQAWVDWMFARVMESLRICKGLVAFVVEGATDRFSYSGAPMLLAADLLRAGVTLRKPLAFARVGIPGSGGPDWLRNDWEFILCATHGGKLPWADPKACGHAPTYAPGGEMSYRLTDGTRRNQWGATTQRTAERGVNGSRKPAERPGHWFVQTRPRDGMHAQTTPYTPPAIANPGNIIRCKVGGGHMGSKIAHENEAPFPQSLAEFMIRTFCPPGGIVLDPFVGSGTTAAAAVAAGRRYVGIDIREGQVEWARRRVAGVQKGLFDE